MTLSQETGDLLPEDLFPAESIARQNLLMLKERLAEPDTYIPVRDYSQKDDSEEDEDNPRLDLHLMKLSLTAKEEWQKWFESVDPEQIVKMLLSEEEYKEYELYKKLVEEEDEDYLLEETNRVYRTCSETKGFLQTHSPDLTYTPYNISYDELQFRVVVTDYQTNVWRVPYTPPQSDLGFLDPKHDPDFLPPSSVSKGFLIKPASRPYNLTFSVVCEKDGKQESRISKPKSAKDYTSVEDLTYLVTSNGYKVIEIKDITPKDEIKWEIDLRISPRNQPVNGKESLIPDPRNYKKIDPQSKVGRRLIRSLKENPYHEWVEISWQYEEETVVALVRTVKEFLIWCYVDKSSLVSKRKRQRVIYPQVAPIQDKANNGAVFTIGYTIRYTDYKELDNPVNYLVKRELETVLTRLVNDNYVVVSKSRHDTFGCVTLTLVNQQYKTPMQRYDARK
jgi:hypothetical protein